MSTHFSGRPSRIETHGALRPTLLVALDEQAHRTAATTDSATLIRTVGLILAAMGDELRRFSVMRATALTALRESGTSYDRIAARTGLSKARVAQLSRAARDHQRSA